MSKIFEALQAATDQFRQEEPKTRALKWLTQDVEELSEHIPEISDKMLGLTEELIVANQPLSVIAESFRFLRSKILWPAKGNPPRTIMITSALPEDGKTFVACNLAVTISQSLDAGVLLIDADLRRPHVHQVFGITPTEAGLAGHLSDNIPLASVIKKTGVPKLSIIPGGNCKSNPVELVSSQKMQMTIREVRDRYTDRFVVIDTPPLELTPESLVMANEVDAVLMVVRYGKTPREAVKEAISKVPSEKLFGIVFNSCTKTKAYYKKYGYKYGYNGDGKKRK